MELKFPHITTSVLLPIAGFGVTFVSVFALNWLALIPWRRSVGKHWSERARLLFPAQASARSWAWLIPIFFGCLSYMITLDTFLPVALCGLLGASMATFFFSRELFPRLRFGRWCRTVFAYYLLLSKWLLPLLVVVVLEVPADFGATTWLIAGGFVVMVLADTFGLGVRVLAWLGALSPAADDLRGVVAHVSRQTRIPVRATWILSSRAANAFALPLTRSLIFTDALLATLSEEQIAAVCAHELEHFNDWRKFLFVRMTALCVFSTSIFIRPLLATDSKNTLIVIVVPLYVWCWVILGLLTRRMSRRMEERADGRAVENQAGAGVYARALARLYEANGMPAVMPHGSFAPHPDLYDRMLAAGVTPDFPKPLPPARRAPPGLAAAVLAVFLVTAVAVALNLGR